MQHGKVVTYASRQLKLYKKNYPTHDLELVVIVSALKIGRDYLYGVHVDVFTNLKSLQYVLIKRELNLCKRRWLEILKDYVMSVLYYLEKSNMLTESLSRMSIGRVTHVVNGKKELVKEVHRLSWLGDQLQDTPKGASWFIITPSCL